MRPRVGWLGPQQLNEESDNVFGLVEAVEEAWLQEVLKKNGWRLVGGSRIYQAAKSHP